MIKDYIKLVLIQIFHRKLRSWLTILGIIIGVALIISLITLSAGLENAINDQINRMGTNSLRVVPKGFRGPGTGGDILTTEDVRTIERIRGIDYVEPNLIERGKIGYSRQEIFLNVRGFPSHLTEENKKDLDLSFKAGDMFKENERYGVVIGYNVAHEIFSKNINVRNSIYINDQKFRVSGILNEMGLSTIDNALHISIDTMRDVFDEPEKVTFIRVQILDPDSMDQIAERIQTSLERKRRDEAFEVYTPQRLMEQVQSILGILKIILSAIAALSLLVGGIGVMNSMFTSVNERTKQIGTMKAIGATNNQIISLFVLESGIMGFIGGIIGIVTGYGLANLVKEIIKQFDFTFLVLRIDWQLVIWVILFSFIVGVISGTLPALKAAKLKPIEALRYE